ncbi:MAG: protein TolR [Candidatus Aquirickettsiella sp.]
MGIPQVMLPNSYQFPPQRRKGPMAEINVVPYIDVMLVLLVIFMVTTPLLSQGIKVNLPQAQAQTIAPAQEPIIVSIDEKGLYYLNTAAHPDAALDAHQLSLEVSQQIHSAEQKKAPRQVFVKGDKKVDYGKVVTAMVLLQQAGAINIGLLTESPPKAV